MAFSEPSGACAPDATQFPGRTVTLDLSAAQVAYLRYLLFNDLQEEAEMLAEQAHDASTRASFYGEDARDNFRGILGVTTGLLDAIGWDTDGDVEDIRWLAQQTREQMTGLELTAAEKREGEDR